MTKTTAIYHKSDFDGIFCREIARKFIPDATLIGWEYGEPTPDVSDCGQLYILDLSVPDLMGDPRLIWIDHHKSAIETHRPTIPGYRIDGVAACRLAYQWFATLKMTPNPEEIGLPSKEDFVERRVVEPYAVRLAGEYDIWDRRDPDAELFQHGLRSRDLSNDWRLLLMIDSKASIDEIAALIDVGHTNLLRPDGTNPNPAVLGLLEAGKGIQYARTHDNESIIKELGFTLKWEGLTFLACNAARYNSLLFTSGLKPEHDACFGFKWTGTKWSVSLYHAPGKEHHDLSVIAVKYGGGGHRGACGFTTYKLPFLPGS
jgi:hypothetical protein